MLDSLGCRLTDYTQRRGAEDAESAEKAKSTKLDANVWIETFGVEIYSATRNLQPGVVESEEIARLARLSPY